MFSPTTVLVICCVFNSFLHFSSGNPVEPLTKKDASPNDAESIKALNKSNKTLDDLNGLVSSFIKNDVELKGPKMAELVNDLDDLQKHFEDAYQRFQNQQRYHLGFKVKEMQNRIEQIRSKVLFAMPVQMEPTDNVTTQMSLKPIQSDGDSESLSTDSPTAGFSILGAIKDSINAAKFFIKGTHSEILFWPVMKIPT